MSNVIKLCEDGGLADIAARLRGIADMIERGELAAPESAVVVLDTGEINVFGLGKADPDTSHLLLAAGQRFLVTAAYGVDE